MPFSHSGFSYRFNWPFLDVLSTLHEKYGAVVKLWLGPTQLLVSIKDEGLVKEMLSKAEDKLPIVGRAFQLAFGRSSLFMPCFDKVQTLVPCPYLVQSV